MRWWRTGGCLLFVIVVGAGLVWCSRPRPGGSLVRLNYPAVKGAPILSGVRVLWGVDKWAFETMKPGDRVVAYMYPLGGGGDMTVLLDIDGHKQAWNRHVGENEDGKQYGVQITIGPLGNVEESHCEHPCALSVQPWWEPWVDFASSIF
jgi:hypothetical protein